jgi:triacylglycerol esterase/lipase EstA (alpha/beta hydrolase family)
MSSLWLAPAVAGAGVAAFELGAFVAAARARRTRVAACAFEDEDAPPKLAFASGWLFETLVICCAPFALPFLLPWPRARRLAVTECRPVLLVHGWGQHPGVFSWLRGRLRREGWSVVHALRVPFLPRDLDRCAERLGRGIERLRHETGAAAVDVVAHGTSGLAARAWIRRAGAASGIARLVTVGTPHRGTAALTWLGNVGPLHQVRPASAFLAALGAEDPVVRLVDVVAIYAADDPFVVPPDGGYYPGALGVEVRAVGHLSLLASRRVHDLVCENLAPPVGGMRWADGRSAR